MIGRLGAIALCISGALAAGCTRHRPGECGAKQVCLNYGAGAEPGSLDPQKADSVADFTLVGDLMMGLVTEGADGQPLPGIADRWEVSPDGLVWRFHLRNARWSDGASVTAGDFVLAYRRALRPSTAASAPNLLFVLRNASAVNAGRGAPETLGARALDERTLELDLDHPAAHLLELLKQPAFYPLPSHTVARLGDGWTKPGAMVSNGPYRLVSWKLGDKIRVERNPAFWDAAHVCVDRIAYFPTTDPVTAERQIKRGELDLNAGFQSSRLKALRDPAYLGAYVRVSPQLSVSYIAMNMAGVAPLRDIRVRRALAESIDRDFIVERVLGAGQRPAYTFVPPGVASYPGGASVPWAGQNLATRRADAAALMMAAGYGPGRPLRLELKLGTAPDAMLVGETVAADWKAIGIEVALRGEERQVLRADLRARDFQLGLTGWSADFNDATAFLGLMGAKGQGQNYGDYANPAYGTLLKDADAEPDLARRGALLRKAEDVLLKDQAVVPLYFGAARNLVNPAVKGWVDNVEDMHRARWLCRAR